MKRIRVCEMVTTLRVGGAERVVVNLATRLDPARFEVHVATVKAGGDFESVLKDAGIPVRVFSFSKKTAPLEFARMVHFLRGRFDVVHAHPGTVARYAAIAAGIPVIVSTLHSVYEWKSSVWKVSDVFLNARTERLIAVSDTVNESARKFYGLPPEQVKTIYNGIDTDCFSPPTGRERSDAREEFGLVPGRFTLAAACHLDDNKRPDLLVKAIALLRNKGHEVGLIIAGDGPMRSSLETLIVELGLQERVRLIGVTDRIPTLLRACDAFAHAALREGFGLAIIEAMSTGLPVVAAQAAALMDVVDHEKTGLLVPLNDDEALAAGIERLIVDRAFGRSLGEAGRASVVERFSIERMVKEHEDVYTSLVG